MTDQTVKDCIAAESGDEDNALNSSINMSLLTAREQLSVLSPLKRLEWAYEKFGDNFVLTTSFGIQSGVLLHMLSRLENGSFIPVVWVDTGYLPFETYRYAEQLTKAYELNLNVAQSEYSPSRMEALHGRLWETGSVKDLEKIKLAKLDL